MSPKARRLLIAALACGAVPLVLGCGIFLAWCRSRGHHWEGLGMLNIMGGLVLFLLGGLYVITFLMVSVKDGRGGYSSTWLFALLAVGVLFANFPACWTIMGAVNQLGQADQIRRLVEVSAIHIVNASGKRLEAISLVENGGRERVLESGKTSTLLLEGKLPHETKLHLTLDGKKFAHRIQPEPNPLGPTDTVVVVQPDGSVATFGLDLRLSRIPD